jgi:hypothetical protein
MFAVFSAAARGAQENGVAAGRLNEAPDLAVLTNVWDGVFARKGYGDVKYDQALDRLKRSG